MVYRKKHNLSSLLLQEFYFIFGGPIEKSEILQDANFYHINKSISYRLWFG